MITIDISTETLSARDGNKTYTTYFLDKSTNNIYKVISGGASCLARNKGEVENRVADKFQIKQINPEIKSHMKYFKNGK